MYGDLLQLSDHAIFVEGQEPRTVLLDQDIPRVLLFHQWPAVAQIYRQLSKRKKQVPELAAFFKYEYPKMPIFLKTHIAGLLLENGYEAVGPEGNRRFAKP